jgi:hypothetical protein
MGKKGKSHKNELHVLRQVDVPLQEVSGICVRRSRNGRMSLIAVGGRDSESRLVFTIMRRSNPY